MSATTDHVHDCAGCGENFTCACSAPDNSLFNDRRLCPECTNQYRRIRDVRNFKSYKGLRRPHH